MKDALLQIADYIEALEQRLAALETRCAEQEALLAKQEAQLAELTNRLGEYNTRITELEARPIPESEIEMDWIDDEPEVQEEPEVLEEPEVEEEPQTPEIQQVLEPEPEPELNLEPEPEPEPQHAAEPKIAKSPNVPINDKMVNEKMVNNPVADLKQAISLGDRFLFQRELFGQNGELMQKTIEALNNMPNLNEALAYLDKRFAEWDKESSTYQLFLNALHRRLG